MTPRDQRFCPICDRPFSAGEAVLRCDGCGVMHHPGCWVKNGGCATGFEHQSSPIALAYASERAPAPQAPHPGEGTRLAAQRPATNPAPPRTAPPRRPPERPSPQSAAPVAEDEGPIIDAVGDEAEETPKPARRKPPASGRYVAGPGGSKPMPSLYGRHRILGYWYIPAAVLVAVAVAFGVIWAVGLITGDDSNTPAGADSTTTPAATASAAATTGPGDATASATAPPPTGGKFQVNDQVVVTGAGSGSGSEAGCLNVRTVAGTENPIIDCLPDGTQLTILGGPQEAGGLTWWNVKLASGNGWAAEDYLQPQ